MIATDAIEVTAVTVHIRNTDGATLESGAATKDHGVWTYRTSITLPANTPWKIEATARNRAGTEATQASTR